MPDHLFEDNKLAEIYDLFAPPDKRSDFAFYLPLVMEATSVIDIGCGTGALLHRARFDGHTGRLVGIDPATGMINQARKRSDIEWIHGEISESTLLKGFESAVMTGHAFQVLLEDEELDRTLAAVKSSLAENGRFVFETRNPSARAWKNWEREYSGKVIDNYGAEVTSVCEVEEPVDSEFVQFSHTFDSASWSQTQVSWRTLRFLDAESVNSFLNNAGFEIEDQFGYWDRSPLTISSPEIITIARRAN
jgi:ubiquinone/menaquinone biosynthesis C-methylase UbiE